jgi:hypothetical protein
MSTEIQKSNQNTEVASVKKLPTIEEAQAIISSGMVPTGIKSAQQLIQIVAIGQEKGLNTWESIRRCYSVNNKPDVEVAVRWAQVQKARLQNGKKMLCNYVVKNHDDEQCTVIMTRLDEDGNKFSTESTYTLKQAEKAGLMAKDNWKKHPAKMLYWRALGNAIDMLFGDVRVGLHQDYDEFTQDEMLNKATLGPAASEKDIWEGELIPSEQSDEAIEQVLIEEMPVKYITDKQRSRLYAIATGKDRQYPAWTIDQIKDYLASLGIASSKEVPVNLYEEIWKTIEGPAFEIDVPGQAKIDVFETTESEEAF